MKEYLERIYNKNSYDDSRGVVFVEGIKDIEVTGNFDVVLMNTNQVIHSKKKFKNHLYCNSDEERKSVVDIIDLFIKYLDDNNNKAIK